MKLTTLLGVLENSIWIIPGITQRKERYNWYFIILGITAILQILIYELYRLRYASLASIAGFSLILCSIPELYFSKKAQAGITLLCTLSGFYLFSIRPLYYYFFLMLFLSTGVFIFFLKRFISEYLASHYFSWFAFALMLYTLTVVTRQFYGFTMSNPGMMYYVLNEVLEITFGLFFIFFRESKLFPGRKADVVEGT